MGFLLLGWTNFTVYMFVCALNINGMLFAALGFLTLTFLF